MIINFLTQGNNTGIKPSVLNIPFFVFIFIVSILTGCGSDDKLPGGANPGDEDPLSSGTPLFLVQRVVDSVDGVLVEDDLQDPTRFVGNGRLFKLAQANPNAQGEVLSDRVMSGVYDVRDLDISHDGRYVLFSMRAPQIEDAEDEDQPTWNLWEYDNVEDTLEMVITSNPENGHDIMARYLPGTNGDIIFSSTRQKKSRSILLDESKSSFTALEESRNEPVLNLHRITRNTAEIEQITFNMSHDLHPTVAPDGTIIYVRWDRFTHDQFSLYRINADGSNTELLYGFHTENTGNNNSEFRFVKPAFLPDGTLYVLARPFETDYYGGDFISIDVDNFIDNTQPTATSNASGAAEQTITEQPVETDSEFSPGGYYSAYHPLNDGTDRALTGWSPCLVVIDGNTLPCTNTTMNDPNAQRAIPSYGLWMVNYSDNTQIPIVTGEPGILITDIALATSRPSPPVYIPVDGKAPAVVLEDAREVSVAEGILHIRSVYDLDGAIDLDFDNNTSDHNAADYANLADPSITSPDQRSARFLKVIKGVPEPDRDVVNPANGSFGRAGAQRMKEIVGYAPIEPDGSVKVRVPANVPLMISITDVLGKRLSTRHQNWITLRPGEVMECKGCHRRSSELPHGRYDAQADSINQGQAPGFAFTGADASLVSPYINGTMAEAKFDQYSSDINLIARTKLSQDLYFDDPWTDGGSTPDDELPLRYEDIPASPDFGSEISLNCSPTWNTFCRIVIHYEDHIQPIWNYIREAPLADDGFPSTCTRCHSRVGLMGAAQIPAGQLELTDQVDGTNGILNRSYVELFFNDIELVDDGMGNIVDCTMEVQRFDENGDPVLDEMDQPIFDTVLCPANITPAMRSTGALASRFFEVFEPGASHADYLTPAELRLIAEWLDIGGQYYNDLFDAPEN